VGLLLLGSLLQADLFLLGILLHSGILLCLAVLHLWAGLRVVIGRPMGYLLWRALPQESD
jgi:hypothetical protein